MVKSHVDCSPDLTWALVQSQNVFVRRSRSATRQKTFRSFSAEKNNLTSLHSFKHSGIAHAGVGIHATKGDKNKRAMTVTVGDAATVVKGIFQQQAKTVAALTAAARPDLVCDALAKASAVQKSRRAQPDAAKASALNNVTRKGKKRPPRQLNEQKQSAVCPDNQRGVSVLE